MAISGGLEKSLNVNKRGGGGKSSKVNVYGVGYYRGRWREGQHMHWIKNFSFLKKNLLRLLHISSIIKMCLSSSFIKSLSLAQLSTSVLPAAINNVTLALLQHNKHSQRVRRTILGLVGKISSWLKINKRGGGRLQ